MLGIVSTSMPLPKPQSCSVCVDFGADRVLNCVSSASAVLERLGWKTTACIMHTGEWRLQSEPLPAHSSLHSVKLQRKKTPTTWREWDDHEPHRLTQCKPNPGGDPETQTFYLQRLLPALPPTYVDMQRGFRAAGSFSNNAFVLEDPQPQAFQAGVERDQDGQGSCGNWLYSVLLPRGFPASVAPEYMQYQLWDTLQVMMADLRSILISNAGLIGQGVGVQEATPLGTMWVDLQVEFSSTCQGLVVGGAIATTYALVAAPRQTPVYVQAISSMLA